MQAACSDQRWGWSWFEFPAVFLSASQPRDWPIHSLETTLKEHPNDFRSQRSDSLDSRRQGQQRTEMGRRGGESRLEQGMGNGRLPRADDVLQSTGRSRWWPL